MARNSLIAVQTQRESVRDQERAKLGALLSEDKQLADSLDELFADQDSQLAEVAGLSKTGRIDINAVTARRYYTTQLRGEAIRITRTRQDLELRIAEQRSVVAQADAAVKAVEKLIEKREEEARVEAARRNQLLIEDQWSASNATKT